MRRKVITILLSTGLVFSLTACSGVKQEDYDTLQKQYESASADLQSSEKSLADLEENFNSLKEEYDDYKEKMKPYEEMEEAEATQRKSEAEAAKVEAENQTTATEAVNKIWDFANGTLASGATRELYNDALGKVEVLKDEGKKAELMAAVQAADATFSAQEQAAAEEEAKGYETGISYDQLARTPDDFKGKKVKFYGKVIQVIEGTASVQIRLAVNDDYDTVLLAEYSSSIVSSRVLDDDHITIYGTSTGTISYKSTMGGTITIPGVYVDKIDQ